MRQNLSFFSEEGSLRPEWREHVFDNDGYLNEDVAAEAQEMLASVKGDSDVARLYWADQCAQETKNSYTTRTFVR